MACCALVGMDDWFIARVLMCWLVFRRCCDCSGADWPAEGAWLRVEVGEEGPPIMTWRPAGILFGRDGPIIVGAVAEGAEYQDFEGALLVGPIWLGAVGLVVGAGGLIVAVVVRGEWVVVVVMLFILVMASRFGEDARVGDVENWISD